MQDRPMITIRCLGPAGIDADGQPAPPELLWRKHLALLIYLARSPRGTRTRDHLLGLLWQDKPGSAARHSLNEALRIIRRSVGEAGLVTTADQVSLQAGRVGLDVDRLAEALGRSDYAAAAGLVAGEYLEGFTVPGESGFEDWLAAERRLWRGRSLEALIGRAAELGRDGDHPAAVSAAELAVRIDPEAEPATRALMEGLTRAGDPAAAGTAFRQLATVLEHRTGTTPSADLAALAERIGRSMSRPRSRPREIQAPSHRRTPLVGRSREHEALGSIWRTARDGRAAVGLILGDAGLGKSRMIDELRAAAVIDGGSAPAARMVEADRAEPHAALVAFGRAGLALIPGVAGAGAGALAAFGERIPEWADRFPVTRGTSPLSLPAAFLDILDAATREGPVLLAVDDAHWADPESIRTLEIALRDGAGRPLALVLAAQPEPPREELDQFRTRIGGDLTGASVALEPLVAADIAELVRWTFPQYDDQSVDRLTRRLVVETGGYPLLLVHLLDAIAAGIDLGNPTPWLKPLATLSQTLPGDLPDIVVAAIRVGFRRLPADAQLLAAVAATGPVRIDPDRLTAVAGLEATRADAGLDQLEWHRWFATDQVGYTFTARIVQEVVARDFVTTRQRRQWTTAWSRSSSPR